MFGAYTGVILNILMVAGGSLLGILFRRDFLKRIGNRIFEAFALLVIMFGVKGAITLPNIYLILASLIIGIAIGEIIDIDKWLNKFGDTVQKKFQKNQSSAFAQGFIQSSLLFCVGSMAIIGSLESGINGDHSILITKGIMDGITACILSMTLGIGVAFSALSLLLYQGGIVLCARFLAPILSAEIVLVISAVGSLLLIGLGLNMLKVTELKVANFIPAMFIPILYQLILLIR